MQVEIRANFALGQIVCTKSAFEALDQSDVLACLQRHGTCDWGDLTEDDKALNELALIDEGRLLSSYVDSRGVKFWIITEWDRSATTILLPEDY